jgi:hypothetical protein
MTQGSPIRPGGDAGGVAGAVIGGSSAACGRLAVAAEFGAQSRRIFCANSPRRAAESLEQRGAEHRRRRPFLHRSIDRPSPFAGI